MDGVMKFSMNGFRHNLTNDCRELKELCELMQQEFHVDNSELFQAVNKIITAVNVLNCVSIKGDDLFEDMSDIEVEHIEVEDD